MGISSITVDGDFTQTNNCGTSIAASSSCSVAVVFGPATSGAKSGTLQVAETSGKIHRIPVKGSGTAGQLAATPTSLDFGSVSVGQSSTQNLKLTNVGGANLTINSVSTASAGFSVSAASLPLVLAKGTSTTVAVTFTPSSAGAASGSIAVVSSASTASFVVAVAGTGVAPGQLVADSTSLDFGSVTVGQNKAKSVKVTNSGGATVTVSSIVANGTGFSVSGVSVPFTIAAGGSSNVNVVFAPTAGGSVTGGLYIRNSAATAPLTLNLAATGVATGQLAANLTSIDFGSVNTGQSSSKTVTLSNTGTASLTISAIAASGTGFSVSGITVPLTLAPAASTTFSVKFSPSASGNVTGSVSVANSASTQPLTIALAGVGAAPAQLTANASNLDFGSVAVGQSSVKTVILSNTGSSSVTVSSVQTAGAGFSGVSTAVPFTIAPGANSTLTVTFAPATTGSVSGGLYVRNSASTTPLTLSLAGVGVGAGQLSANPTSLAFGSVTVGQTSTKSVTLSNTGSASLSVSSVTTGSAGFSVSGVTVPLTLAAGATSSFSVTFAPTSGTNSTGSVSISSSASTQPLTIALSGTGIAQAQLTANPTSLDFGNVNVGKSSSQTVTLSNTGGTSLTVTAVDTAGTGFSASAGTLPFTMAAGTNKTVTVTFSPTASGSVSGGLYVRNSTSTTPLTLNLKAVAVGTPQLTSNPTSLSFGNVNTGQSSSKSITLSNTGSASLTITGISTDGPGFSASGLSVPLTLAAGATTSFNVKFAPSSTGAASGHVYIADSVKSPDVTVTLAGTGTTPTPVPHSVSLLWTGSVTTTVVGYNIYRGTQDGGPYTRINSAVQQSTSYSDASVQNGTLYYYVVTAVDNNSTESTFSNQTTANIPAQ